MHRFSCEWRVTVDVCDVVNMTSGHHNASVVIPTTIANSFDIDNDYYSQKCDDICKFLLPTANNDIHSNICCHVFSAIICSCYCILVHIFCTFCFDFGPC